MTEIATSGHPIPETNAQRGIDAFCRWLGITREEFFEIVETFRNRDIWTKKNGAWVIENFLVPDWPWHEAPAQRSTPASSSPGSARSRR